jgi:hypothetical protein
MQVQYGNSTRDRFSTENIAIYEQENGTNELIFNDSSPSQLFSALQMKAGENPV